jgi:hypothetical protein
MQPIATLRLISTLCEDIIMKGEPMKLNQDKFIEYYSRKETEELLSIHVLVTNFRSV